MQHYFKSLELVELYGISRKTVHNWIQAIKSGSLDLQLVTVDGKDYIANTGKNRAKIHEMVEERRKYRNSAASKTVKPSDEFYRVYSPKQIRSIMASIENHHEIPLEYTYLEKGAQYWDDYVHQLADSDVPNILTSTDKLLDFSHSFLDSLVAGRRKVNVIDVGVGTGLPARNLLVHLQEKGILGRYIGIDISQDMLDIAQKNIQKWFGGQVPFVSYLADISREGFDDVLSGEVFQEIDSAMNIVLLFGGTLLNLRTPDDVLRNINRSMWANDVLIYSTKLDTPNSRQFFDFNPTAEVRPLGLRHRMLPDMLNIDESLYEVEQRFDTQKMARTIRIRLNVALRLEFTLDGITHAVQLDKGDSLLVWRFRHHSINDAISQFDRTGFNLLQNNLSEDYEYLLMLSRIKNDSD